MVSQRNFKFKGNNCVFVNVVIGDNVAIVAIGYFVAAEERRFSGKDGLPYLKSISGYIVVKKGVRITNDSIIGSNDIIDNDINKKSLVVFSKTTYDLE